LRGLDAAAVLEDALAPALGLGLGLSLGLGQRRAAEVGEAKREEPDRDGDEEA
jgi:hypothetical protein